MNDIPQHTRHLLERLLGAYCERICPPRARHPVLLPRSHNVIELLREFDADPKGLLWGRVNGKSLRWCRSEGRCDDCDERYCRVLGTRPASTAAYPGGPCSK